MTYATLLDDETTTQNILAVLKPRRLASTTWTNVSGNIYSQTFTLGTIVNIEVDGPSLTEAASSAVSTDEFFYDSEAQVLYINVGSDPALEQVILTYEIYVGTIDAHWYRVPTDDTTSTVYFEPLIVTSPSVSQDSSDVLFGFLPTRVSGLTLSNVTNFWQNHVYDSSFNDADIDIYHWLGDLETTNVKRISQVRSRDVSLSRKDLRVNLVDAMSPLDKEWRHKFVNTNFFTTGVFSGLDPKKLLFPIRKVWGVVDKFVPVNIDYNDESPSTSNNRDWVVTAEDGQVAELATQVVSNASASNTRTYYNASDIGSGSGVDHGFRVGDIVRINGLGGTTIEITAINQVDGYFEHADAGAPFTVGHEIYRFYIPYVKIVRDGITYTCHPDRDYTRVTHVGETIGFTFKSTMEANITLPSPSVFNPLTDQVYCRVYGNIAQSTLISSVFGTNSDETGGLTNPVAILYEILKEIAKIPESQIDSTSFTAALASVTDEIGFAVPETDANRFPKIKDVIVSILKGSLLKLGLTADGKFYLNEFGPKGASSMTIEDDEILSDSVRFNFGYDDIYSDILVNYASKEFDRSDNQVVEYERVTSSSTTARFLHKVDRQLDYTSYHFIESQAQTLADRLAFALGDRSGKISLDTKNRFFESKIGDVVEVSRDKLPGYEFVSGTDRSRDYVVTEVSKGTKGVSLTLDDQKGVEDNSGSW